MTWCAERVSDAVNAAAAAAAARWYHCGSTLAKLACFSPTRETSLFGSRSVLRGAAGGEVLLARENVRPALSAAGPSSAGSRRPENRQERPRGELAGCNCIKLAVTRLSINHFR